MGSSGSSNRTVEGKAFVSFTVVIREDNASYVKEVVHMVFSDGGAATKPIGVKVCKELGLQLLNQPQTRRIIEVVGIEPAIVLNSVPTFGQNGKIRIIAVIKFSLDPESSRIFDVEIERERRPEPVSLSVAILVLERKSDDKNNGNDQPKPVQESRENGKEEHDRDVGELLKNEESDNELPNYVA